MCVYIYLKEKEYIYIYIYISYYNINRLVCMCPCVCVSVCVCVCTNAYSSQTEGRTVSKFWLPPKNRRPLVRLYLARNSTTLPSGGNSASSRFSWHKVWNGVKCNFSSAHHHNRNIVGKLSIRRVWMWNFTRIGPTTKKLWLSIIPTRRPSGLGPPQKGVNCNFFSPEFEKPYGVRKLLTSDA